MLGFICAASAFILIMFNAMTVIPSAETERAWVEMIALTSTIISAFFWFRCRKKKPGNDGPPQK